MRRDRRGASEAQLSRPHAASTTHPGDDRILHRDARSFWTLIRLQPLRPRSGGSWTVRFQTVDGVLPVIPYDRGDGEARKSEGGRVKIQREGVDDTIIPSTYLRPLSSAFPPASALARDRAGWGEPDGGEERRTAANLAAPAPHRRLPPPTSFVRQGLHLGDAHDRFSNPPHVTCSPLALVQPRDVDGDVVMRQLRHVDRNAIPVHSEWDGEESAEQSERKNRVSPPVAADEKRRFRARASLSGPRPRFATRHWSLAPPPWLWPAMPSLPPSALESRELPRLHIVTR